MSGIPTEQSVAATTTAPTPLDPESHGTTSKASYWRIIFDQGIVTDSILQYKYAGNGTHEDPFLVKWIPDDPRNPMNFSELQKWVITLTVAFATLAVSFVSSAYTGGAQQIIEHFHTTQEIVTLGLSLFVLGFALGPLLWAPLSVCCILVDLW